MALPTLQADPAGAPHITFVEEMVADVGKAMDFYSRLFGWEFKMETCSGVNYPVIDPGLEPKGGFLAKSEPSMPSAWMPYVKVDDLEAALARALARGAVTVVERMTIDQGEIAVYADPHGAHLGLFQAK